MVNDANISDDAAKNKIFSIFNNDICQEMKCENLN